MMGPLVSAGLNQPLVRSSMTRRPATLITGANGAIGRQVLLRLAYDPDVSIITLDVTPLDPELRRHVHKMFTGSILDERLLTGLLAEFEVTRIFHLAAVRCEEAEISPVTAHSVNVEGTLRLLEFAYEQSVSHGQRVLFLYISSLAVYGLPDQQLRITKPTQEEEWNRPQTIAGCNQLYCEKLGNYYQNHLRQLNEGPRTGRIDFRALRPAPLLVTEPSDLVSVTDYPLAMLRAAVGNRAFASSLSADTLLPFILVPDCLEAILALAAAERGQLHQSVYNVRSFCATVADFEELSRTHFPNAVVEYQVDPRIQKIVNSWPGDLDIGAARRDLQYEPGYDLARSFADCLVPSVVNS